MRPDPAGWETFPDRPGRKLPAVAMIAVPLMLLTVFSAFILHSGVPGFSVDKTRLGLAVSKITADRLHGSGIRAGDVIVNINGLEYNEILPCLFRSEGKDQLSGGYNLIIVRNGKRIQTTVTCRSISLFRFFSKAWLRFLLVAVLLSLGTISYFRVSVKQPGFAFLTVLCMFSATFSATMISQFGVLDPVAISFSFFCLALSNWMAFGALLHFVFRFPASRDLVSERRWVLWVFYLAPPAIPILISLICSSGDTGFWICLQRFRNIPLPVIAPAIFIKHFIDYQKLDGTVEKQQVKLIISAFWLSFGPYLVLYAIPNILLEGPLIGFQYVVMSSLILPAAYFLGLIRYRLLDVDKLISRTVSYYLLILGMVLVYSYLIVTLKRTFLGHELLSEEFILVYMICIAVVFEPLIRLLTGLMDRVFLPAPLYRYAMLPDLSRQISSTIQLQRLIRILTDQLPDQVGVRRIGLIVFGRTGASFYPKALSGSLEISDMGALQSYFIGDKDFFFCRAAVKPEEMPASVLKNLGHDEIEVVFALRGGKGLAGCLLVGHRNDSKAYAVRDITFLATLAGHAGLALENALHYQSLLESKSQLEKMFEKVAQSEKMAALGEMSTILAHELKNPLGIIRSSAQYLAGHPSDTHNRSELLAYIMGEVDGLEQVINNMMELARYRAPEPVAVDLSGKTAELVHFWKNSRNHALEVEIELVCEGALPKISVDFQQLQQVLLNCISNAEDAMHGDGQIMIRMQAVSLKYVEITICDTGPGISERHMEQVFHKFFTTKEKGMGIGLCVCRQIIQAHHGSIALENMDPCGLCVRILLPVESGHGGSAAASLEDPDFG